MIKYYCSSVASPDGYTSVVASCLKEDLKDTKRIVFIPANPEDLMETSRQIDKHLNYFKMIDITFESVIDITKEITKNNLKEIIINADLIMLLGGNPLIQMDYLIEHGLDTLIKQYDNVIMGFSAGAMCMSKYIIITPCSEEYPIEVIKDGMNLSDITIFPHFNISKINQETIDNEDEVICVNDIKEVSTKIGEIYLLTDIPKSCIIRVLDNIEILDGQAYKMIEGSLEII